MTFDLETARDLAANPIHCPETDDVFRNAIAEIERLRAELAKVNRAREAEIDQAGAAERMYLEGVRAKDARIKELDGMLDARSKEIVGRIQECQACQIDQLQAEGKIGPDAKQHDHTAEFFRPNESPAKSWQITDERVDALRSVGKMEAQILPRKAGDVLLAMLEEVGQ